MTPAGYIGSASMLEAVQKVVQKLRECNPELTYGAALLSASSRAPLMPLCVAPVWPPFCCNSDPALLSVVSKMR